MPSYLHVVDLETTGLYPGRDDIVEIGIAKLDLESGKISKVFDQVIKPKGEYNQDAWVFYNTSLTTKDVDEAKPLEAYFAELFPVLANNLVVAYNASFDVGFLRANGFDLPAVAIDPMEIATNVLKIPHHYYGYKFPKFQEAWNHYFGFDDYFEEHRAYDDAYHEAKLIHEMIQRGDYTLNN